jgi:hypothetical protein
MTRTVGGADVGKAVVDYLREYTDEVSAAIRREVDDAANDIKAGVQSGSPVGASGKYAKGWRVKKLDSQGVTTRIVHNAAMPGLVHLLEHGHAKRGGGRVAGRPHVAPAAEPRIEQMVTNIKRIVENGGDA